MTLPQTAPELTSNALTLAEYYNEGADEMSTYVTDEKN